MKKTWKIFALAATVILMTAGCHKYEKIELESPEASQVSAKTADRTKETAPEFLMEPRNEIVYVYATSLNLRTKPGMDGDISVRAGRGTALKRLAYNETWSQVEYEGKHLFASSQYLKADPVPVETTAAETLAEQQTLEGRQEISLNPDWKYAGFSKINSGKAVFYSAEGENRKNKVICINAGHGTKGGSKVKTQCHPDGTPKVTGGTTSAGATSAVAVSGGMEFADGTSEAKVTLAMAKVLKNKLLAKGYDVLMIRENDDVQLDNIARTVIANNQADCHIALHWDSTSKDKGAFYMSVPKDSSYRSMEPVASHWQEHHRLGDSLVAGLRNVGVKIFSDGTMAMDLTQTSYSTVPSVDIELGDKISDHSSAALERLGDGLAAGVDTFFGN